MRTAVQKLVEERGLYPSRKDKIKLSEVLGKLFNQRPQDFFDLNNRGYLPNALKRYRYRMPPHIKKLYEKNKPIADKDSPFSG